MCKDHIHLQNGITIFNDRDQTVISAEQVKSALICYRQDYPIRQKKSNRNIPLWCKNMDKLKEKFDASLIELKEIYINPLSKYNDVIQKKKKMNHF